MYCNIPSMLSMYVLVHENSLLGKSKVDPYSPDQLLLCNKTAFKNYSLLDKTLWDPQVM